MIKDRVKNNLATQMVLQIIEDGKRPMSIRQIMAKYELSFPFMVRKVVNGVGELSIGSRLSVLADISEHPGYNEGGFHVQDIPFSPRPGIDVYAHSPRGSWARGDEEVWVLAEDK